MLEVIFYWISGGREQAGGKAGWRSCAAACQGTQQLKTGLDNDSAGMVYSSKECPPINTVGSFWQWSDRKVYTESDFRAGAVN